MNTFLRHFDFTTLVDHNFHRWLIARQFLNVLDFVNDLVTLQNFTKNDMAAVEPAISSQ